MTRPRKSIEALSALNRKSCELAFAVEDLDWSIEVDRSKPWAPEEIGPLWFIPSVTLLTDAHRLRCNQLHALGLCEKFIWFEQQVIRSLTNVLRTQNVPHSLREALWHFIREEDKHMEMFWRLLEKSEPDWYRSHKPKLFGVSTLQQFGMDRVVANPEVLLAWIWLAIFVEERTLFLSRLYIKAAKEAPGRIDALHTQVHDYHFRDEARHYQLDQHLLTWLYDPQPRWKKTLCAVVFRQMVRSYVSAGRAAPRILAQLGCEFPELRSAVIPRMLAELPYVGSSEQYHRKLFSRDALPHTLALLAEYPEHDRLWELFIAETKQPT